MVEPGDGAMVEAGGAELKSVGCWKRGEKHVYIMWPEKSCSSIVSCYGRHELGGWKATHVNFKQK